MAWVAVGVAGATLAGSVISSGAAKSAANSQIDAANRSNDIQLDMYNQNRTDQDPYRQAGYSALDMLMGRDQNYTARNDAQTKYDEAMSNASHLQGLLNGPQGLAGPDARWAPGLAQYQSDAAKYKSQIDGYGPAQTFTPQEIGQRMLSQDPGYQARLDQGNKSINAAAAARGMGNSGRTMKELTKFGSDHAANEYGNAYNRLASMAGIGQSATNQTGQYGSNYANQAGQNFSNIGNAQAAGQIGQANAVNSGIGNAVNWGMQNNYMDILKNKAPAASSGGGQSYLPTTSGGYSLNY